MKQQSIFSRIPAMFSAFALLFAVAYLFMPVTSVAGDEVRLSDYAQGGGGHDGGHTYQPIILTKSADVDTICAGDTITYKIRLRNACNQTICDIKVVDDLPRGVSYIPGSATNGGQYNSYSRTLRWKIDKIKPGKYVDLYFKVVSSRDYQCPSIIINKACIDDSRHCVCDYAKVIVIPCEIPEAHIELDKSVSTDSATVGDTLVYTINVANTGDAVADSVVVVDMIPAFTQYLIGSATGNASYNETLRQLSWLITDLAPGAETNVSFAVVVDSTATIGSGVVNVAHLVVPDTGTSDTTITVVVPKKDLSIVMSVDSTVASPGSPLIYTMTVTNNSSSTLSITNLLVVAPIPLSTGYIVGSASDAGIFNVDSNRVEWIIPSLDSGQSIDLSFGVIIDSATAIGTEIIGNSHILTPILVISNDVVTLVQAPVIDESSIRIQKSVDRTTARSRDTLTYTITVFNIDSVAVDNIIVADTISEAVEYLEGSATPTTPYNPAARTLTWNLATLPGYDTAMFSFRVVVDSGLPSGTQLSNAAYVLSPDTIPTDTIITTIVPKAILNIDKSVDPVQATVDDTLTYTITVTNSGDTAAFGVTIVDTLPNATTLVDGSITNGGVYNELTQEITWQIAQLNVGSIFELTFAAAIDSGTPSGTQIQNIAYLVSPDTSTTDTTITTVIPKAKLSIDKSVDPTQAIAGDTLSYTVTVRNTGDTAAFGILIVDTLPNATTLVEGSITNGGVYDAPARLISWSIPTLGVGDSLQLLFDATVDSLTPVGTLISNVAYLVTPDTSHTDTVITEIVPDTSKHAILSIDKAVDPTQATEGDTLNYTVTIRNTGDTAAFGLLIIDTLPNATTLIDGSITNGGVYDAPTRLISWNIPTLGAGDSLQLLFAATVDSLTPVGTLIANVAYLLTPDTSHTDTVITEIVPDTSKHAILAIDKSVDPTQASTGDTLSYTISVSNTGDTAAFGVVVVDTVPQSTQLITESITAGGIFNPLSQEISWTIPVVGIGATAPLSFDVIVDPLIGDTGHIFNIAYIVVPDTIPTDTTITTIVPDTVGLNLVITMAVDSSLASPNSILTYTVTITNNSANQLVAKNISTVIPIPELTAFVPGSITGGGLFDVELNRITWLIDSLTVALASASSAQLTFQANIAPTAIDGDSIIANATIQSPQQRTSNNAITVVGMKTVSPDDFAIVKSVDRTLASPGDTLHYLITVANVSDSTIEDVVVVDQIPAGAAYVVGSATNGGTFSAGNNSITWAIGTLLPGAVDTVAFAARINTNTLTGTVVSNQAFITEPVLVPSNITNTTVAVGGEFVISKAADRAEVTPGDTVTYTISYLNQGPVVRTNVVITDTLAASLQYVSSTNGGVYNTLLRSITWAIGNLGADAAGSVQFRAIVGNVANGTQISNVALINGTNLPLDTTAPSIITVRFPELELTKSANPEVAAPGDTVLYQIIARNTGLGVLNSAFIDDNLPDGFTYVANSARRDTTAVPVTGTDPIRLTIGNLAPSDTAIVTYQVAISTSITSGADYTNSAILRGLNISGDTVTVGPATANVAVGVPNLRVTKTTNTNSARVGSLVLYTVTVENNSDFPAENVTVFDRLPNGLLYVEGSSVLNGDKIADPTTGNPIQWVLGTLEGNEQFILNYTVVIGPSAGTGRTKNVAWVETEIGNTPERTNESGVEIFVTSDQFHGSIRGRVVVDCDGDGVADVDTVPVGARIYLDDGQVSQVNKAGMFYFSTVRAVDHVVALDERSMVGFHTAEGEQASVFVKVHEMGESYILFRVCLDGPNVSLKKKAAVVPQAEIQKTARINHERITDSAGVVIDYDLALVTTGGAVPTRLRVVDTLPKDTRAILRDSADGVKLENGVLTYETSVANDAVSKSVYYSLEDLAPGSRRTLTNNAHVEADTDPSAAEFAPDFASPAVTVSVGPFGMTPPRDIQINVVGAQFETSKANLKPEAEAVLRAIADSILKYSDAHVVIEGHADIRPIHTKEFPSNWELSTARAKSVRDWFARNADVDTARMSYEGFAATRPVDARRNLTAYAKNRRVEVFLKANIGSRIDLTAVKDTVWRSSVPLSLQPSEWSETEIPTSARPEGISRSVWMIQITITNNGPGIAEGLQLLDTLPTGVTLMPGSVTLDGMVISDVQVIGKLLSLSVGSLEEGESTELRYEITATAVESIAGGGSATIQLRDKSQTIKTSVSNPVRIK